jgi:hypothetical protein
MTAKSAANKPRIKQSFFCAWIERACHSGIADGIANSRRKACGSQRLEAFLGLEKCLQIRQRQKIKPARSQFIIAGISFRMLE